MSDFTERMEEQFSKRVESVASRLREMADAVERHGTPKPNIRDLEPDYVRAAAEVAHVLHWGLANADLDGLIRAAGDVVAARALEAGET